MNTTQGLVTDWEAKNWLGLAVDNATNILKSAVEKSNMLLGLPNIDLSNIDSFLATLKRPESLDDFVEFKSSINQELNDLFKNSLKQESENFRLSFSYSDVNMFKWDEKQKSKLEWLIKYKHEIYYLYLSEAIKLWSLDLLFNESDKNTIKKLINSKIFNYINDLYLLWKKDLHEWKNKDFDDKRWLRYAWLVDWKIVPYKDILSVDWIDSNALSEIENEYIKGYFTSLLKLLQYWETSYATRNPQVQHFSILSKS